MTQDEFIQLLNQSDTVNAGHISDLKEMISYYPYFAQARVLLAKAMHITSNLHIESYIQQAALHVPDRRGFYYFLYPERMINTGHVAKERIPRFSGNYFDMLKAVENNGEDATQSLKNLEQRLKSARETIMEKTNANLLKTESKSHVQVRIPTPEYFNLENNQKYKNNTVSEEQVKILIKKKKYREAIEILNKLNLINPKKSIYFADQIRFLEKILVNSKK